LENPSHRRSMAYEGFPRIAASCPNCGAEGCAVYRGYYTRNFLCTEIGFYGPLVIRTGHCRRLRRRFALLPDFVIYRRRISRPATLRFLDCHRRAGGRRRLQSAIDEWIQAVGEEEYYVPRSTAWTYLKLAAILPP
jgi:hypothetical protein